MSATCLAHLLRVQRETHRMVTEGRREDMRLRVDHFYAPLDLVRKFKWWRPVSNVAGWDYT